MNTDKKMMKPHIQKALDAWLTKYPSEQKRSGLLYALRLLQEDNGGYLEREHMDKAADYLGVPRVEAYQVATFYSMYYTQPVGRYRLTVCNNITCMLCGSETILEHLKKRLNIGLGEVTPDGRYSLHEVECLAACGRAPVLQVNDKAYHEHLTPDAIDQLLEALNAEDKEKGAACG